MKALRPIAVALAVLLAACSPGKKESAGGAAQAPTVIRFATDWRAQAEQGGFYEALANGEYKRRGLDVKIVQGGPGVNVPQLLAAGAVEMGMGSNSFIVMNLAQQGVPVKLAIGLDSVFHTSLSGRVGRYINFYVANGAGTRVEKSRNFQGTLENVDVESVPGVGHLTIDKNELIQQKVIAAIDAAVRGGPGVGPASPGATPVARRPIRAVAPQASGPKRAAVN